MRFIAVRLPLFVPLLLSSAGFAWGKGVAKGPYLQNPTPHTITVCWVSDADCLGSVRYAADPKREKIATERTPTSFHRIKVERLEPNTVYRYWVTCNGSSAEGTFKTAVDKDQPFKFVVYGDNRTQPAVHTAVLKRMSLFQPDFIIQTGDMVANGENLQQWDEYWQIASPTLATTPMFTTLGNHERNGAPYFRYFQVPRDYSFDYGDAHFVALDSNRPQSEMPVQIAWLRKDLAAHRKARWRIVFMHHTLHTCTDMPARRMESEQRRKLLAPVLFEGKVQLFLSGHDHNYQHHLADGITYLVSGGGGAPLYDLTPNTPYVLVAKKAHHHCEVVADRNKLSIRAVEPDGTVIDEFEIKHLD